MNKWTLCAPLILCTLAFGQSSTGKLAFEVASIKPSDISSPNEIRMGQNIDAGLARFTNFALKDYIRTAYRVKNFQVDGPAWIENARFNIEAKLPAGATRDQVPEMLQTLLAERFKLTLHRETKDHAVYGLVVGKGGPKLKPVEVAAAGTPPSEPGRGGRGPLRAGAMSITVDEAGAHLKASTNLANLAEMISRFSERPVLDQTGISGDYEFDLVFSPDVVRGGGGRGAGGAGGPGGGAGPAEQASDGAGSIYDSVQRFGLKLEPKKAAIEILIVDNIEKAPTEN